jgi:hypothetical protein
VKFTTGIASKEKVNASQRVISPYLAVTNGSCGLTDLVTRQYVTSIFVTLANVIVLAQRSNSLFVGCSVSIIV